MATYTPNYQLHQWVPEDNFLRTDFNEDFSKIDTALANKANNSDISNLQGQINNLPNPDAITNLQNQINTQQQQINSKPGVDSITNLQNQINTQQGQINTLSSGKAEFVQGSYTGNGTGNTPYNRISQTIYLGFQPRAVFISGGNFYGVAIGSSQSTLLRIVATGMEVTYDYAYGVTPNTSGVSYTYLALR